MKKSSFYHTPLHSTLLLGGGGSRRNIGTPFGMEKLECMMSLPEGEKNVEDIFIRFDVIHERDRRTDGHRVTAYIALMRSIAR